MDNNAAFDDAYWLHQPPAVRALRGNPDPNTVAALVRAGYSIDLEIMAWGLDPWKCMWIRQNFGIRMTWVPAMGQNILFAFSYPNPQGLPAYDPNNPPRGSIKVSTDLADYPPFDPPPPPAMARSNWVGVPLYANLWTGLADDPTPDGAAVETPDGAFIHHSTDTPFGRRSLYEKVS